MSSPSPIFDIDLLTRRRERAVRQANAPDFLHRRVAEDFADRLALVRREFPNALDLGSQYGTLGSSLRGQAGIKTIVSADLSPALVQQCDPPRVVVHPAALPLAPQSFELVVSGLALQLVDDLPGLLVQVLRALTPDGLFLAAMLGGETLKELRAAWLEAEADVTGGASPRVAPFADLRDVGSLLQRAGFALAVADADSIAVTYPSALALMREIKALGASNMLHARSRRPVTRGLLARACQLYEQRFALPDGRVPATFEIVTLTAWAPHDSQQRPLRPGSASHRLADALGVREHPAGNKTGE